MPDPISTALELVRAIAERAFADVDDARPCPVHRDVDGRHSVGECASEFTHWVRSLDPRRPVTIASRVLAEAQ